ncbi:MAG: diaminobutyrate--2-oxoglutarate transaminase [Acidimicrobiales bacterium]|nr:diaminobutyrate--2-oxoglutarate transaminase [Acidimicrobiales bacterium]
MKTFETHESEVRGYIRSWPTVFTRAQGWTMTDEDGRDYLDFFAGAGALNYGHNHPAIIGPLTDYLGSGAPIHTLDMATSAKQEFIETFVDVVLRPRGLDYKLQFPGPTGTNAVEAALKLARKVTGRESIISFTNAFHGMSLGSLAVTGNSMKRAGAGVPLANAVPMPYAGFLGDEPDSIDYLDRFLLDDGSGVEPPAAVILETIQAEGGVNVASEPWLRRLFEVCKDHGVLVIVDDIQVGCGRTGPFFSFEEMGLEPDIICLSKSLSGSGLPLALVLLRPDLDVWEPGEHNGTFRGNNPAFVTATAAMNTFWRDDELTQAVAERADQVHVGLEGLKKRHEILFDDTRGRGLIQGLGCHAPEMADRITTEAFKLGLMVETAGPRSEVVKLLPPLIVTEQVVDDAIERLDAACDAVMDLHGEVAS